MSSFADEDIIDILLVEDEPDDVRLTKEALKDGQIRNELHVVTDGVEAMDYVRQKGRYASVRRPDLILLDLNMPRKNGFEVLREVKTDPKLKLIPIVILSTSAADEDVAKTYGLNANCYISKPVDLDQFFRVIKGIEDFWLTIVKLPPAG